jgi:hypothetical protein
MRVVKLVSGTFGPPEMDVFASLADASKVDRPASARRPSIFEAREKINRPLTKFAASLTIQ